MNIRLSVLLNIARGLGAAILITLAGMAVLAAVVVFAPISDGALVILNQILKVASIFMGTILAVGVGGRRGFAHGAVLGLIYMVFGYAMYCLIDGALVSPAQMAGEFAMGLVIGALSGAIAANLRPRKKRKKR